MISLRRIDHVRLRVTDVEDASRRWCAQFGLVERERDACRVRLVCDDEPYSLELVAAESPGIGHVAYELRRSCTPEDTKEHFNDLGVDYEERDGGLEVVDPEGNKVLVLPYREPGSRWTPHARPAKHQIVGHPRKLGHVNFLTGEISRGVEFYTRVLGMRVTDWLGDGGVWFHIGGDHHVMALVDKGYSHLHHLAFDVGREPNKHMAFGPGGIHHCLGAHLARLEVRITFEELLKRVDGFDLTGPPERLRSNFFNGIKRLPVRVTR